MTLTFAPVVSGLHQGRQFGLRGIAGRGCGGIDGSSRNARMEGVMVNIAGSSRRGGEFGAASRAVAGAASREARG
ncbi:hypothetical protein G5V65_19345 [Rhodobacter sp. HX-7-19]|uniref:Uncharacterized protein n=1 Tax=Paragemmobacter kunshanensis TaxID=2583234 RepID=A0A6M1TXY2_9RHOB|nr:hypothetical protein [Rhodobacter kunshanensis]NGQ93050.1 hypothetical protein [Rhodobacter kunshanensis]